MDPQEARIFTAVAIAAVLLGIILVFFAWTMVKQQRRQMALQKELLRTELDTIEAERSRIAADLHDELAPRLSVVRFQIDDVVDRGEVGAEDLKDASESIDGLIGSMREIANNLMPVALQRKGLARAIQELTGRIRQHTQINVVSSLEGLDNLPGETQIQLYRMVQEMLHNSVKHAEATEINLDIVVRSSALRLFFKDNGKGFEVPKDFSRASGLGLNSLRSRAEFLGSDLQVESKRGVGTAYLVEFPV